MRDILLVHSSDLHLRPDGTGDGVAPLRLVLEAVGRLGADLLVLAGDVFDANRLPQALIEEAARLFAASPSPVVLLPGNHDCILPGGVYEHPALARVAGLHIIGVNADGAVTFPHLELEVWGRPHRGYRDMRPLAHGRPRSTRRSVAVAHGHWVTRPEDALRSWLITDEEIASTDADYVALGHWELPQAAGDGRVPAYYSGSPQRTGTVNAVWLRADGAVEVQRAPLVG